MRSRHPWLAGALLLAGLASGCGGDRPQPNETLVLVTFERLPAAETGSGGHPRARTPHLDRLARTGRQAVEARTPSPGGRISLGSILTGLFPDEHGLENDEFPLGDAATLASIVGARGYRTAAFAGTAAAGSRHGLGRGFDRHETRLDGATPRQLGEPWRKRGLRPAGSLARALTAWLAEDPTKPGFAWIHLGERGADADGGLGEVLGSFDLRETLVVATAATGDAVPFIVAGPGVTPGTLRRGRTSVADAAPLLASALAEPAARRAALADPPADRVVRISLPPLSTDAASRIQDARIHDRAGRTTAALRAYEDALRAEPRLVEVRMRAAELARRSGDSEVAVRHAQTILENIPEHREARILLSRVLARENDRRGPAMLEPVLAGAPHHPGALVAAGEVAISRGDPLVAATHYRHALASAHEDAESLLDVGRGLSRLGLHREAVETVHRALDRGDRGPDARYTLAWVLEQAERFPESVQEYRLLIRDHPEYLPAYRNLGALMARDGEVERAIRLWEEGLRHHPDDPGLRANVEAARAALGEATLGG